MRRFFDRAKFSRESVLNYVNEIGKFHRIQGSRELVDTVLVVKEFVGELGVEVELHRASYDGRSWHLTLKSPIAWELVEGKARLGEKTLTTGESPLLVMAHSPPGEAEGEVLPILREEDWERAEEKVVLVGRDWREAYRKANEAGAKGFIAYREKGGKAFPYIGLFLTEDDMEWAEIPAIAVPEEVAKELTRKALSGGVRARINVESEVKKREDLPMLLAKVGEPPYILFTAHICHPKPGANDNASGSAMLMELARALSNARSSSRFGFAFLWVPEYHGTQAFVDSLGVDEYYTSINLDMVAGSPDRSGSTLMLVRTPLSRFSMVSGLLEAYLELSNSRGSSFSGSPMPVMPFRAYPYEMGSDHDVLNFFGVPAVMPITWPDRFYHSSEDSVEKLSRETIGIIGRAVLATALALAEGEENELRRFARAYSLKVLGELSMERDTEEAERLVLRGLARDSVYLGINVGHDFREEPWLEWKSRGILNERLIRARNADWRAFKQLTKERKVYTQLHELLMLGEILPRERALMALEEEYGRVEKEKLENLVELLAGAGIVSLSSQSP
ncbi:DUF4910 domain-containing protein [Thermococcus sp.]|uniref:DUF4910 domain-containing protein n=1 Tax=Thermococcus sp. TaxID=35749 RepID=UPI00262AD0FD|nr:DUF4910 domain-containing protein [Thermococcus sp.]